MDAAVKCGGSDYYQCYYDRSVSVPLSACVEFHACRTAVRSWPGERHLSHLNALHTAAPGLAHCSPPLSRHYILHKLIQKLPR
ncbi:hypothetical protein E2C01_034080 [Portunus trituberculatus]|uniref:Uncharacterized protein n=1 Tax=Portunus trituberculatus TaxID=210409 RepID=A0A5B7EZK8_PORTR|nr:hypothetical protein [Portunus trituberculatus]